MRRLIAVATCNDPKYLPRANAQRSTWAHGTWPAGVVVHHFVGHYPSPAPGIQLDVPDDYLSLPAKVRAICQWAIAGDFDFIFKTDDDTYINLDRLVRVPLGDYVGNVRGATGGYPAAYASGYAYWLSRKSMEVIANAALTADPSEDRWVGNTLLGAGIRPLHDRYHYRALCGGIQNPSKIWTDSAMGFMAVFGELQVKLFKPMQSAFERYYPTYCRSHRPPRIKLESR